MFILISESEKHEFPEVIGPFDTIEEAQAFRAKYRDKKFRGHSMDSFTAVRLTRPSVAEICDLSTTEVNQK